MRIGIVPTLDERVGGVYHYSLTMLDALLEIQNEDLQDSFVIFTDDLGSPKLAKFKNAGWQIVPLYKTTVLRLFIRKLIKNTFFEQAAVRILSLFNQRGIKLQAQADIYSITVDQRQRDWFLSHQVDLIIYPNSNILSFKTMIPYIFTVHDLQHRIQPKFPEVSVGGEWEEREYAFINGIKNALLVLVDSQVGKEDVLRFYKKTGVQSKSIKILPYLYASYTDNFTGRDTEKVRKVFDLPREYLFYPAQFWPHKNHLRIVKALGILKNKYNLRIPIVFCGSHSGNLREKTFDEVMNEAKKLELVNEIYYIGYVEDKYMSALYKGAKALIMPTFFGPTNIPILEAWKFDCPVITSDIRGIREQVGRAGLLVNPSSIISVAAGIKKVWLNGNLRNELIKLGKQRLAVFNKDHYNKQLHNIINEAKKKINEKN